VLRAGAQQIPWQEFNPTVHQEGVAASQQGMTSVVFTNAPNVVLNGDRFYISTNRHSGLNWIGAPNVNEYLPEPPELDQAFIDHRLHFYDASFFEAFDEGEPNRFGVTQVLNRDAATVNIAIRGTHAFTADQFDRTARLLARRVTQPGPQVTELLRAIIERGERLV
jgi:hypothetical protein